MKMKSYLRDTRNVTINDAKTGIKIYLPLYLPYPFGLLSSLILATTGVTSTAASTRRLHPPGPVDAPIVSRSTAPRPRRRPCAAATTAPGRGALVT